MAIEQEPSELARLAVDGKPLQLLSAVTHRLRLTLGSVVIDQKSNEPERSEIAKGRSLCPKGSAGGRWQIPALAPLLRGRPLEGSLITADAMHCQQESARLVTQEIGGDYLFGLKGNQSGILERAECKLSPRLFSP